jgi:flagellar biosynthetic protein FliP
MRISTNLVLLGLSAMLLPGVGMAADVQLPGLEITIGQEGQETKGVATAVKILLGLTVLSLAPAFLIAVTSFSRIIIVLAMLRHALGMQETPPNTVLITLALFLTLFTMLPVFQQINVEAFQPYMAGKIELGVAFDKGLSPLRDFMIRQTREQDLALMVEVSRSTPPREPNEVSTVQLVPAFMLSELKSAFQIGFVIFLPFLLIDLLVSSVLMSMGMFMVPPVIISLPIKVLMFVLIDGWNLVVRSLVGSIH